MSLHVLLVTWVCKRSDSVIKQLQDTIFDLVFSTAPMYSLVSVLNIRPTFPTSLHSFGTVEMTSRWSKGVKVRLNVYRKAGAGTQVKHVWGGGY